MRQSPSRLPFEGDEILPGSQKVGREARPKSPQPAKAANVSRARLSVVRGATGPKQNQSADSETRFRAIFENSGSGMALVDMQGRPVECNPALLKMLGYTSEELGCMSFIEFTHPDDRELDSSLFKELISGKRDRYEIEKRYIAKDGRTLWGNLVVTLVPDRKGTASFALGMVQDITERKLAEDRVNLLHTITLEISEAPDLASAMKVVLRRVCEATGWVFGQAWIPQHNGLGIECCSTYFARGSDFDQFRIHSEGITMARGVGLPGRVFATRQPLWVPDVTVDNNFPRATVAKQTGLKAGLAVPIVAGEAIVAVLEFYLQQPREQDEQLVKVIAMIAGQIGSICARKLAEQERVWSEERLRMILDSAAEGIFGVDLEGKCVFCNAASLRILGYAAESEVLGKDMHRLLASKRADGSPYPVEECPAVQSLITGKSAWSDADVFWRKDGTYFPAEYWAHPMFRDGKHIGAVITFLDITQRKYAQESLRASEERFAKAFHACPEPIAIFHHRSRTILEVNERWQTVFGHTREESLGRTVADLKHMSEEDRDRVYTLMENERSIRDLEVEMKTKAGEVRNVSLSAEQIEINGELCDIYISRDVTDQKRIESQNRKLIHDLGERVKELTLLHQTARILQTKDIEIPDLLGQLVPLFPAAWQYPEITEARIRFGNTEEATPGFAVTPWLQSASFKAGGLEGLIEVVYREERPEEAEGPFLKEERTLLESVAEMLGASFDRRIAQSAVSESEERFRQLMENIREVFWMNTPDFSRTLYVNPAYERIWGRSREEQYEDPKAFLKAIHEDDRQRVMDNLIETRGRHFEIEYRLVRSDGSVRWIRDRGFPIHDATGRMYRIAGFAEDITERKESEQQLIASSEQLRALSDRLRKAKEEEGIRISRELHDELGGALTGLKWGLMAVRSGCVQDGTLHEERNVGKKIDEMVGVVDSTINTVRRISSELRPGVLDDLGLISAIEWHARHFEANTGIVCRFDSQIENLELDRDRATAIFRIYQETMTNVLRHSRASTVKILIEQEENEFVLEVSDNGRGIREDEILGTQSLGIVGMRERAHSIGGRVEITSYDGKGTTVICRVPL